MGSELVMLARCKRVGGWFVERLKDLFYGPGNNHLDWGRLGALFAFGALTAGLVHNMRIHQPIELGPTGLGGGLAAILGALQFYLFKERQRVDASGGEAS
jgi:hypothetical protein